MKQTIESGKSTAVRQNQIKKRKMKPKSGIKWANVIEEKRMKRTGEPGVPSFVPPPEPPIGTTTNIDELFDEEAARMYQDKVGNSKGKFKPLDRVKIKTTRFGKSFAKGKPVYTFGTVMKSKGKVCDV